MPLNHALAQDIPLSRIFLASLALIALVVVGLVVVAQVKKRLHASDEDNSQPTGFTLSDLRALHRAGRMSDEEFARAKEQVIHAARRVAEPEAPKNDQGPRAGTGPG